MPSSDPSTLRHSNTSKMTDTTTNNSTSSEDPIKATFRSNLVDAVSNTVKAFHKQWSGEEFETLVTNLEKLSTGQSDDSAGKEDWFHPLDQAASRINFMLSGKDDLDALIHACWTACAASSGSGSKWITQKDWETSIKLRSFGEGLLKTPRFAGIVPEPEKEMSSR